MLEDVDAAHALPADLALALLAGTGAGALGGALVRAPGVEEAERWLWALRAARREAAPGTPWRVVPAGATADRLDGGIDVAATLAARQVTRDRGLIAEAAGGVLALPRAAGLAPELQARLAAALDDHGQHAGGTARTAVVAVVTGAEDEEALGAVLGERLALHVTVPAGYVPALVPATPSPAPAVGGAGRGDARGSLGAEVREVTRALCDVADAFGVGSPRALVQALRTARALAARAGRPFPDANDAADAVRLVLAPRATRVPAADVPDEEAAEPAQAEGGDTPPPHSDGRDDEGAEAEAPEAEAPLHSADDTRELLIAAARTALPVDLLDGARTPSSRAGAAARAAADGRRGMSVRRADERRGRLVGVRPALPRGGPRLALVDTLRAAAPWQPARGRRPGDALTLHAGDLRVERRRRPLGTTTILVVDASGSAALGRLAEAKGAAELLLAESYARRDRVALVAFRGASAEVVLPPTRALARARRAVGALPAGGGTPLAAALVCAAALAGAARREGARPAVVLLTDGRANIALDGTPGRRRAQEEARGAARALAGTLGAAGGLAVVVDTTARPGRGTASGTPSEGSETRALAQLLGARHVALPHVDARALHAGVRAALDGHEPGPSAGALRPPAASPAGGLRVGLTPGGVA